MSTHAAYMRAWRSLRKPVPSPTIPKAIPAPAGRCGFCYRPLGHVVYRRGKQSSRFHRLCYGFQFSVSMVCSPQAHA
jgi:hypothetical protein